MATTGTYTEQYCSAELTRKLRNELVFLSVANTIFSITAFLGNTLILIALHKETSLNKPSKLLLRGLATTDLCVGIIAEPVNVANWISLANGRLDICFYTEWASFVIGYILCSVSFVTLTAISVDRLLALLLGMRYQQIVTVKKTYATIVFIWVFCIACTLSHFGNAVIPTLVIIVSLCLCLVTTIFSYTKIILTLRQSQILVHSHNVSVAGRQSRPIPLNITRYRKAVYSALWVQTIYCYFGLLKLIIKPVVVLLEDQRSKASGERNNKATLLFTELINITFLNLVGYFCFVFRQSSLKNKSAGGSPITVFIAGRYYHSADIPVLGLHLCTMI
ncbi:unnamed protein product [Porites evermanni]|uniref:G-protein coupled receptors family 1 profile domain-containing protein n=1 Tax=Porites evermanni TaxID=104178 RepID=A0ABN8QN38_9CNID|nr:unnamed protein product [Porites evermanni]